MDPEATTGPVPLSRIFEKRITLGNVLTILSFVVATAFWYDKINDHITDMNIHHSRTEIRATFDERWDERSKELFYEMKTNNSNLEYQMRSLSNEVNQLRKELGK